MFTNCYAAFPPLSSHTISSPFRHFVTAQSRCAFLRLQVTVLGPLSRQLSVSIVQMKAVLKVSPIHFPEEKTFNCYWLVRSRRSRRRVLACRPQLEPSHPLHFPRTKCLQSHKRLLHLPLGTTSLRLLLRIMLFYSFSTDQRLSTP